MRELIGKKLGMSRAFNQDGTSMAVTLISCGPCPVLQVKTEEKDGYQAIQIGYGASKEKNTSKAIVGHCKKAGMGPVRMIKEFWSDQVTEPKAGQQLTVEMFAEVAKVDVIGLSKGRGFAGTIKRYNFSRGKETHGNKNHRAPGSIGAHSYPARVWPGQKLPGHYGNKRITVKNLEVVGVDPDQNTIAVRGSVPGPSDGFVVVRETK